LSVKIRLRREGGRNKPSYRIVVVDSRTKRDGKFIERLGHYNPTKEKHEVEYDEERVLYWLGVGAIPSDTVKSIFKRKGTWKKHNESKAKSKEKK
jgi:small subunit ribosomal protein S16